MDAVTAIMNDHRLMARLFDKLRSGEAGDQAQLVTEIKARLSAHSVAEEEHVYPAIAQAAPAEQGEVHHGVQEHRQAEQKLAALEAAVGGPDFDVALGAFVDAVMAHVDEEESEILPSLQRAVSGDRLAELGETFERRRIDELAKSGIRETPGGAAGPDRGATKAALYEQAQQADIPGRSSMSKDQLAQAIEEKRAHTT